MTTTWVLVANSDSAKIYEIHYHMGNQISKVQELSHVQGRLKASEINSDKPGRTFASMGYRRSSLGQTVSPHVHEQIIFAKELALLLDKGRMENSYKDLVLIAAPQFLGHINRALSAGVKASIRKSLSKDFPASRSEKEVVSHITNYLNL